MFIKIKNLIAAGTKENERTGGGVAGKVNEHSRHYEGSSSLQYRGIFSKGGLNKFRRNCYEMSDGHTEIEIDC